MIVEYEHSMIQQIDSKIDKAEKKEKHIRRIMLSPDEWHRLIEEMWVVARIPQFAHDKTYARGWMRYRSYEIRVSRG